MPNQEREGLTALSCGRCGTEVSVSPPAKTIGCGCGLAVTSHGTSVAAPKGIAPVGVPAQP